MVVTWLDEDTEDEEKLSANKVNAFSGAVNDSDSNADLQEKVATLTAKLENTYKSVRMLNSGSNMLEEILEETSKQGKSVKGIGFSYKSENRGNQKASRNKKESMKGKIERTVGGARVMSLHTSSSTQSKKNLRTPSKKHYKSRATPMQNPEAPVLEDVSNTSVSANDEDDVATSSHGSDETLSDKPAKEVSLSKDSSSSSKSSDSKAANSTDVLSEESMKTPPIVHDVSDDEDSEDVPLASVAARMLKRRRASVEETPVVQKKKAKITTGSSKSRATDVSRKGK
ncbi:nuclear localization sequence-binding protein-like [Lotus japonicus]|uniref:nuclear localization sequence-binding protein-like n=1 Tax=Lotus japonicus TaxID=34305 RepID=UPI002588D3E5|nr:nuclear localization sequence-binding protein-like [Lotus japonicus]